MLWMWFGIPYLIWLQVPTRTAPQDFHEKLQRETHNFSFLRLLPLEALQRPFIKNKWSREGITQKLKQ